MVDRQLRGLETRDADGVRICREAVEGTRRKQERRRAQRGAGGGETLLQLSAKHKQVL